jgi:GNAT superfamily N-acetyltransferase
MDKSRRDRGPARRILAASIQRQDAMHALNFDLSSPAEQVLELQELAYLRSSYQELPAEVGAAGGASYLDIGGGARLITPQADILGLNRALGLGLRAPLDAKLLENIIEQYRSAGVARFFLQVSPSAETPAAVRLLSRYGFRHYNNWMKLFRPVYPYPEVETPPRVEEIDAGGKAAYAAIIQQGFAWPEQLRPLLAHPVGRPGWKHYLALDGAVPVAAAALFMHAGMGSLAFAATLPGFRGRGAQSALIARRIRDAARAGCRWITVETGEDRPDRPVPSYRNMRRLGFRAAYTRSNYLFNL